MIGATGRSGMALGAALRARGTPLVPIVRDTGRWAGPEIARVAAIENSQALSEALSDATQIVSTAHARHAGAVIAAAPANARFVFLGSTRKFTRWPDAHGDGVKAGEAALFASGRRGVMLHPTMIYGAQGEDNVQRLAALLRRLPLVPLPGGGRALVQPIYQGDVTRAILAALEIPLSGPESLVIAGPAAMPYAAFVRAVAQAAGLPSPRLVPVPQWLVQAGARAARLVPGLPRVAPDEIRRLTEDKDFSIEPMRQRLSIEPISLAAGLTQTFQ